MAKKKETSGKEKSTATKASTKASSKKATAKKNGKDGQTKTDAIREALRAVKDGSPSEVAKVLNAKGIKVSAQYVSTIKAADKRRASSGGPRRKPGRPAGSGKAATTKTNGTPVSRLPHGSNGSVGSSRLMKHLVPLVLDEGADAVKAAVKEAEQVIDMVNSHQG